MDWRQAFRDAEALPDSASGAKKATRGRDFEKILSAMLGEAGLKPRLSYRPAGEEIDGSFWFHGRTVLVEAKWTAKPHPASSLYQFKGKVDGKFSGTIGVFISMSGFSKDSVDALVAGKELNIVLFDADDIRAIVDQRASIETALELKLRAAGDDGNPYAPLSALLSVAAASPLPPGQPQPQPQPAPSQTPPLTPKQLIVAEGRFDVLCLQATARAFGVQPESTLVAAGGPMNIPRTIRTMLDASDDWGRITAVIDEDARTNLEDLIRRDLEGTLKDHGIDFSLIAMRPDLEAALGLAKADTPWRQRRQLRGVDAVEALAPLIDPEQVLIRAQIEPPLRALLSALGIS